MSESDFAYTGQDNLEAMKKAKNYNRYLASLASSRVAGKKKARIIDFGAGIGTYASLLRDKGYENVDCLEIDKSQVEQLSKSGFKTFNSISSVGNGEYDLAYSFNVFEHIEADKKVLEGLLAKVKSSGEVVIYVPAFKILFSKMDELVEHQRRYSRRMLKDMCKFADTEIIETRYCDPLGFCTTLLYKAVGGKSGKISPKQVGFYDRYVFPFSRALELFTHRFFGKNLYIVVRKK